MALKRYVEPIPDLTGMTLEAAVCFLCVKCNSDLDCVGAVGANTTKAVIQYVHDFLVHALNEHQK